MAVEKPKFDLEEIKDKLCKRYIELKSHPGERVYVEAVYDDGSLSCIMLNDRSACGYFYAEYKDVVKIEILHPSRTDLDRINY